MKKIVLLTIFLMVCQIFCMAQDKTNEVNFHIATKAMEMSFIMPEGYTSIPVQPDYNCGDGNNTSAILYNIANKDSSIVIAFSFIQNPDSNTLAKIRKFTPGWDSNKNYIKLAKAKADTINHKISFYNIETSRTAFNADDSGQYIRACQLPYRNVYRNYKDVFLFKKDRGNVTITYFYTDIVKDKMEEYIKPTEGMLKFNDL